MTVCSDGATISRTRRLPRALGQTGAKKDQNIQLCGSKINERTRTYTKWKWINERTQWKWMGTHFHVVHEKMEVLPVVGLGLGGATQD